MFLSLLSARRLLLATANNKRSTTRSLSSAILASTTPLFYSPQKQCNQNQQYNHQHQHQYQYNHQNQQYKRCAIPYNNYLFDFTRLPPLYAD